jgi:hypothetical protein
MNRLSSFSKTILFFITAINFWGKDGFAQDSKQQRDSIRQANVKNWVESQQFLFVAQFAFPMNGRSRALTTEYDLKVRKDGVESSLPYYGQAYSAPIGQSSGGIQFKSKSFEYSVAAAKKGGWDIRIRPKDVRDDVYRLTLHISSSGTASLQVSSNNRQSISFNGYITSSSSP